MGNCAVKKSLTVILANGDFPRKGGRARALLETATRVVCCDGAADSYRRIFGREPTAVVGDLDSCRGAFRNAIRIAEQETNDLDKAIRYCLSKGWRKPVLVGVAGKREDHTLGNVFRALARGLEIVTDRGRFVPFCGRGSFTVGCGSSVSIFAPEKETRMTSKGLEWPLDGVRFENLYCATLNRASAAKIKLTSTHPVYLYFPA